MVTFCIYHLKFNINVIDILLVSKQLHLKFVGSDYFVNMFCTDFGSKANLFEIVVLPSSAVILFHDDSKFCSKVTYFKKRRKYFMFPF